MPSFDATFEHSARVIDSVVVVLIVDWSCEAVAEHTLGQWWKGVDWVLVQESGRGGRVALGSWHVRIGRDTKLVELIFSWAMNVSQSRHQSRETPANTGRLPLLTSGQSNHSLTFNFLCRRPQQAPWTCAQPSICVWIVEADEEERNVVLPGYSSETTQIWHRDDISVSIILITDLQFFEIGLIMHIPAEDNRAETEAVGGDGKELLLRHEFATENAIHVNAGDFDSGVILEELWKGF